MRLLTAVSTVRVCQGQPKKRSIQKGGSLFSCASQRTKTPSAARVDSDAIGAALEIENARRSDTLFRRLRLLTVCQGQPETASMDIHRCCFFLSIDCIRTVLNVLEFFSCILNVDKSLRMRYNHDQAFLLLSAKISR